MSKFKSGGLVLLTNCNNAIISGWVGTVQTLKQRSSIHKNSWLFDPPMITSNGLNASWHETHMAL